MGNITEETLILWTKPASNTEDEKINNAVSMIKSAISSSSDCKELDVEIFVQGSYANNTNVRQSSDVDVNVMLKSTFYVSYPNGTTDANYGFHSCESVYSDYKKMVLSALINKFGKDNVFLGDKSIKIKSNSYHVEADCVPTLQYRNYRACGSKDPNTFIEGVKYHSLNSASIINYPKLHLENGKRKNIDTDRRYKKTVRIFKRLRNEMVEVELADGEIITSFLVECLIWNLPDKYISGYASWNETVKQAVSYLYHQLDEESSSEWREVSERLYLFYPERKWTKIVVQQFLRKLWNYMGY
jgi:hypothetical protein